MKRIKLIYLVLRSARRPTVSWSRVLPALVLVGLSAACAEDPPAVVGSEALNDKNGTPIIEPKQGEVYEVKFPTEASTPSTQTAPSEDPKKRPNFLRDFEETEVTEAVVVSNAYFHDFQNKMNVDAAKCIKIGRNKTLAHGYAAFVPLKDGTPDVSRLRVLSLNPDHGRLIQATGEAVTEDKKLDIYEKISKALALPSQSESPPVQPASTETYEVPAGQLPPAGSLIRVDFGKCDQGSEACGALCAMVVSTPEFSNEHTQKVILAPLQLNKNVKDFAGLKSASSPERFSVLINPLNTAPDAAAPDATIYKWLFYKNLNMQDPLVASTPYFLTMRRLTSLVLNEENPWEPCDEANVMLTFKRLAAPFSPQGGNRTVTVRPLHLQAIRQVSQHMFAPDLPAPESDLGRVNSTRPAPVPKPKPKPKTIYRQNPLP